MKSNRVGYITGILDKDEDANVEGEILDIDDETRHAHIEQSAKIFGWQEQYSQNKDYVLRIFRQRYIYNDDCLEMMFKSGKGLFHSKEHLRELLYMRSIDEADWGMHPLTKLVHDIDQQITELELQV